MIQTKLKAVVFDWAGTTIDHGCLAPAKVFQEVFHRRGVAITEQQARGPMGTAKRDHIAAIAAMPKVAEHWRTVYGNDPTMDDVDSMYAEFLPLQLEILGQYTELIPGTAEVFAHLKSMGVQVGSTTGYTRELMSVVLPAASRQGYTPDSVVCSDDVQYGRPAPWMMYEALHRANAYPVWQTVKVDDTPVGIVAGKNAGAVTVAVTRTGNQLGLGRKEVDALSESQLRPRLTDIAGQFEAVGADFIIQSIDELPAILPEIEQMMR